MQSTPENPQLQQDSAQKKKASRQHLLKLRSPVIGYIASFALVGGLLAIERLDALVPQAPLFLGAPFGLLAILVALLWGIGPALVTLLLSLIVLAKFISPGIFTSDIPRDLIIIGPFIVLEIVAIAVVIYLEQARRALLTVHQELEKEHANVLQSHKQLEQASALKDYVLTRAAHEFRTPLTTILGRTQLLASRLDKSGETPENWHAVEKYIGIVEVRALHLRSLIDSLFELSRVQSEKLPSPLPLRDLKSLCLDVIEEVSLQTERIIELDFPANDIVLPVDEKRLFQALANILNNAAKYSEEDTPISVQVSSTNEYATLQIHNTSPTPDPEQLEQFFQPFYRTPDVQYSSTHGWGLGLTISKEIVERHRGKIWAKSPEGKGLSVLVQLPLREEGT